MRKSLSYPIEAILANPNMFIAISAQLEGYLEPQDVHDCFFEAYSSALDPENAQIESQEDIPDQVQFSLQVEGREVEINIFFNNGVGMILKGHTNNNGEGTSQFIVDHDGELSKISQLYRTMVSKIEKEIPEFTGEISLKEVPSRSNNFLQKGDEVVGRFSLLSNPEKDFGFRIHYNPLSKKTETIIFE